MGLAGIVLAVLAIALTIIPTIGWILATLCLVSGLSLSTVGLIQHRRGGREFTMAIAGIATNIVVIIVIYLWIYLYVDPGILIQNN